MLLGGSAYHYSHYHTKSLCSFGLIDLLPVVYSCKVLDCMQKNSLYNDTDFSIKMSQLHTFALLIIVIVYSYKHISHTVTVFIYYSYICLIILIILYNILIRIISKYVTVIIQLLLWIPGILFL